MNHLQPSGLSLARLDPSDERDIRQWYQLRCAVRAADQPADPPPCWVNELGGFRHPWPGEQRSVWLAWMDGSVVGGCELSLPTLDNPHNAGGDVLVAPRHRRRGISRALLEHLRAEATGAGRIRLVSGGWSGRWTPPRPIPRERSRPPPERFRRW